MTSPDTLAEAAARKAMMAPYGRRRRYAAIARILRAFALATKPEQRSFLAQRLESLT